jgi:TolB-like protein/Tfp pilus assembly protein PilF
MECPECHINNPDDSRFCSGCGASLVDTPAIPPTAMTQSITRTSPLEFAPGEYFGSRYQIVEEIGRGGMGIVYKALDRELDRVVALKIIRPELGHDPEIVDQFKQELRLASEISHENVIRIHDLGETGGIKYISMRYIAGTSLRDLLDTAGRLTSERAIGLTQQICNALTAAHKSGVIHRDLKPQNIMLDRLGNTYVMDFGVAALAGKKKPAGSTIVGTPNYMSPEQAAGKAADERSDIYSLGCILYEMVAGRKPLDADTVEEMIRKHTSETPQAPSDWNPAIPQSLESITMRCLEKDPADRYGSAAELQAALDKVTLGGAVHSGQTEVLEAQSAAAEEVSVAVLPFRDMSPEKDQEYFCDGIAEELTNALVKVDGLRVAALSSAFQFKDKAGDVREVGAQLNVTAVVEGSVRKAGNRLRITAQLVNVADGYHMWSERYDRDLEDVFAIQDEISHAIVDALRLKLIDRKGEPVACCTHDLQAYNLYLKGRYHWNKRSKPGIRKAREYFAQAIELEPSYALAYVGLADAYMMSEDLRPKEVRRKAKAMIEKALEIDDGLAEAHTTLAWILFVFEYNRGEAEREFELALELNPNYPTVHHWYALFLAMTSRRDSAIEEVRRAQELDPLSLIITTAAAWILYFARRFDDAIGEIRKAIEMDPTFVPAYAVLGQIYLQQEDYPRAIAAFQSLYEASGKPDVARRIGGLFKKGGYRPAIAGIIAETTDPREGEIPSFAFAAELAVTLGDDESALAYMEKAFEEHEDGLIVAAVTPGLDRIRSHPRFQRILKQIGSDEPPQSN